MVSEYLMTECGQGQRQIKRTCGAITSPDWETVGHDTRVGSDQKMTEQSDDKGAGVDVDVGRQDVKGRSHRSGALLCLLRAVCGVRCAVCGHYFVRRTLFKSRRPRVSGVGCRVGCTE